MHVAVKVMCRDVNQTRIIRVVVPVLQIMGVYRSGAANNDTPIWPRDEILIDPLLQSNGIRGIKCRERRVRGIGDNGSTADASNRNYLACILGGYGSGIRIGREHDVLCFN